MATSICNNARNHGVGYIEYSDLYPLIFRLQSDKYLHTKLVRLSGICAGDRVNEEVIPA